MKKPNHERIYLIPGSYDGEHCYVWSDDPAPGTADNPADAVEYVRADLFNALKAELDRLAVISAAKFEFKMRAVPKDPTGYYFPRWEHAEKVTVIAETKEEAISAASIMLGKSPRGWPWAFLIDEIRQQAKAGE